MHQGLDTPNQDLRGNVKPTLLVEPGEVCNPQNSPALMGLAALHLFGAPF